MIITDMQKKRRYHNLQFTPMKYYQFRNDTCGRIVLQVRICVIFNLRLWKIYHVYVWCYYNNQICFVSPSGGNIHLDVALWR